MPLALYTFGLFRTPADDPANDGFYALNDLVFDEVDTAPGFIARSGYAMDDGTTPWGSEVYPPFYQERGDGWSPATLSLWEDLESILAFTYGGLHKTAVKRGSEWFQDGAWPPLVLWWHKTQPACPTWAEGVERYMRLHTHGPTATAFSFKTAFTLDGRPLQVDSQRVRALKRDLS